MDPAILKIGVPVSTFILGSGLTLLLKTAEQRRTTRHQSVLTLRRLTNEWYNQLQELFGHAERNVPPEVVDAFTRYLNNRIILPEVLMHVEVLRGKKGCETFLVNVVSFLQLVTNYKIGREHDSMISARCIDLLAVGRTMTPRQVLDALDPIVQRISIEAGALVK